jgi:hypothetical protein
MKRQGLLFGLTVLIASVAAGIAADTAPPGKATLNFQNGVNGYEGTIDVEIWAVAPNTCLEGNPTASADADNDGGESQILLRFESIIGDKPGQIPPNSTIHSAKLVVSAFDPREPRPPAPHARPLEADGDLEQHGGGSDRGRAGSGAEGG